MEKTLIQRPSNCIKVVLFGPESTGKTTLSKALADHFGTLWVASSKKQDLQKPCLKIGASLLQFKH